MRCTLCRDTRAALLFRDVSRAFYKCGGCSLIFADPSTYLEESEEKARYESHNNHPDDPAYRAFLARLIDPLRDHLVPGMEGLDYGSGPGPAISVMLAGEGLRVTNWDPFFAPDKSALERRYDFVTCTETVEHFHDPAADFDRLASLLKPGGILAVMTEMIEKDSDFPDWCYNRDPTHVCFFRKATMRWIAAGTGR